MAHLIGEEDDQESLDGHGSQAKPAEDHSEVRDEEITGAHESRGVGEFGGKEERVPHEKHV